MTNYDVVEVPTDIIYLREVKKRPMHVFVILFQS